MDAMSLLKDDHQKVKKTSAQMARPTGFDPAISALTGR